MQDMFTLLAPGKTQLMHRGCPIHLHKYMGDHVCDPIMAPYEEMCCYDGGDCIFEFWQNKWCKTCPYDLNKYVPLLKKGQCVPELNTLECCYSAGTCLSQCDTCMEYNEHIGDGVCDDVLNHEECCFDSFDCDNHMNCTLHCPYDTKFLGDGVCDLFLSIPDCCYDNGDCLTLPRNTDGGPNYPLGAYAFEHEPSLEQLMWWGGNNPIDKKWSGRWFAYNEYLSDQRNAIGTYKK